MTYEEILEAATLRFREARMPPAEYSSMTPGEAVLAWDGTWLRTGHFSPRTVLDAIPKLWQQCLRAKLNADAAAAEDAAARARAMAWLALRQTAETRCPHGVPQASTDRPKCRCVGCSCCGRHGHDGVAMRTMSRCGDCPEPTEVRR